MIIFEKIKPLPFLFGLGGLVFGYLGQMQLAADHLAQGALFFLIGIALMVVAFRRLPGLSVSVMESEPILKGKWAQWGMYSAGLALILAAGSFGLFTNAENPSIVPWLLYIAGILVFVLAIFWLDGAKWFKNEAGETWSWLPMGLLLLILGLAAFLRIYRLDQIPFGTWYDEADNGLNALRILNEPGYFPVFSASAQLPAQLFYLMALSFKLLGVSTVSIRAVSVAFGLATVAAAYFTGRELFNSRRAGLLVAFLLAVSRWDINWSRIGMHGVTVPFFELLSVGLIIRALRRQRLMDYALAGLTVGLGLGFYFSFRLFPVVIALFCLLVWLSKRNLVRTSWRGFLVMGLAVIIASVPVTQFIVTQPDAFFGRMKDTSIFNGKTLAEGWQAVAQSTQQHLLMFNFQGDHNGRHNLNGEPMLDPISGTLMVLGLGLCLWRIRQPGSFLLAAWLLLMLIPGIFALDFEAPQSYRAIGSLPAACLLIAVPIQALWQEWERFAPKLPIAILMAPSVLILGWLGLINADIYFNRQAQSFDTWMVFSTPDTIIGKMMAEMGDQVDFYISTFYYNTPTLRFLAPQVTQYHRLETQDTLPILSNSKKGRVMIVDPDRKLFYLQAQKYYPNGTFKEIKAPNGTLILYEIVLSPEDIAATQGLTASYYQHNDWNEPPFLVRKEPGLNFDWQDGSPAAFPLGVEWQGLLFAQKFGSYRFQIKSPAAVELFLDGTQVTFAEGSPPTSQVELAQGSHTFRLRSVSQAGHFELAWQPPDEPMAPIPVEAFLQAPISNNGLVGRFYANSNWEGPAAFAKIDPWIHFYFHNTPLPRPYTAEWTGKIKIPADGRYRFGLESVDESSLFIDEKRLIDDSAPNQLVEAPLDLTAGFHTIRLRFADHTGSTHINFYWQPPEGNLEPVPQENLFPY